MARKVGGFGVHTNDFTSITLLSLGELAALVYDSQGQKIGQGARVTNLAPVFSSSIRGDIPPGDEFKVVGKVGGSFLLEDNYGYRHIAQGQKLLLSSSTDEELASVSGFNRMDAGMRASIKRGAENAAAVKIAKSKQGSSHSRQS